jgi:hypothetical protein
VDRSTIPRAIGELRPLLAERGCTVDPGVRLRTLVEVIGHLGKWADGDPGRHRDPCPQARSRPRRPGPVHLRREQAERDQGHDPDRHRRAAAVLRRDPAGQLPGHHASPRLWPVDLLADGSGIEILADAGYQGLGAQTVGQVVTPPHWKFRTNAPEWYEQMHAAQRHAHSARRIRVEHDIAHLKNWRSLARHHGRRENLADTIQAIAAVLSHQQATAQPAVQAAGPQDPSRSTTRHGQPRTSSLA